MLVGPQIRRVHVKILLAFVVVAAVHIFVTRSPLAPTGLAWPSSYHRSSSSSGSSNAKSPFSGAFARFSRVSDLPERQRRLTIISVWNGDGVTPWLRHHLYTMQLNADQLDLLLINRWLPDERCLDFDRAGLNITWGGNIKVVCMDDDEYKRRHVDYMCSAAHGWDCDAGEYEAVLREYRKRENKLNWGWRPFQGWAFRDLIANQETAFWAWLDFDIFVGDFRRFPFNVLSQVSFLMGHAGDEPMFLSGQMVAFNFDDPELGGAWKAFPELRTAKHFTENLDGRFPDSAEERYWSYGYLRPDAELPGARLSWAYLPDIYGDDFMDGRWNRHDQTKVYVISGREVLFTPLTTTREEIEAMFQLERTAPVDDFGGLGWTPGEDGSDVLLENPAMDPDKAKAIAVARSAHSGPPAHSGRVEIGHIKPDCLAKRWTQCVPPHPLTMSKPPLMRSTLVHLREQPLGHVLNRLERDDRPRGYERKLFRHHVRSKRFEWFGLPDYDITDDLVLRYNSAFIEVFRMGPTRNATIFFRSHDGPNIG